MPGPGDEVSEEIIVTAKPPKANDSPFGGNPFDEDGGHEPEVVIIDTTPEEIEVFGNEDDGGGDEGGGSGGHTRFKGMGSILLASGLAIAFSDIFAGALSGPAGMTNPKGGPFSQAEEHLWGDTYTGMNDSLEDLGGLLGIPDTLNDFGGALLDDNTPFWVELVFEGALATGDPPRSDYEEQVIEPPESPYTVERWHDDPEHQRLSEICYLTRAAILAEERRQGAVLAGDYDWAAEHERAAEFFGDEAEALAEGLPRPPISELLKQMNLMIQSESFKTWPTTHRRGLLQAMAILAA